MNLNWALDKEHAKKPDLLDADHREIVWFDILEFFNHIEKPWTLNSDDLKHRGKKKVEKAKEHFENGGWMDPCYVMGRICDVYPQHADDERLMIENRHRLIAALQLGETHAPCSVPLKLVEELKLAIKNVVPK